MSRYQVDKLLRQVVVDEQVARAFRENPTAVLEGYDLSGEEREALLQLDYPALCGMGAHPFLLNGFVMTVWPGDRRELMTKYGAAIAHLGYPEFST